MKKNLIFALALLTVACGGDDDDGTDATMDGSVMDTSAVDGSSDASVSSGTVTVRVLDSGTGKAGVDVVFHGSDGAVLETVATDSSGEASRTMDAGGMVTIVQPDVPMPRNGGKDLYSYYNVQPGDVIELGEQDLSSASFSATLTVTMPAAFGAADLYDVRTGCSSDSGVSAGSAVELSINEFCLDSDSTVDVVAIAEMSGQPVAYSFEKGVAVTDGGTHTLTLGPFVPADAEDEFGVTTSGALAAETDLDQFTGAFVNGVTYYNGRGDGLSASSGSSYSLFTAAPTDFIDAYGALAFLSDAEDEKVAAYLYYGTEPKVSFDRANGLPSLGGAIVSAANPERPEMLWVANGSVDSADAGVVQVTWETGMNGYSWMAIFPPTMNMIRTPALPDKYAALRPTVDSIINSPAMGFYDFSNYTSYSDFTNGVGAEVYADSNLFAHMPEGTHVYASLLQCYIGLQGRSGAFAGFSVVAFLGVMLMRGRRRRRSNV